MDTSDPPPHTKERKNNTCSNKNPSQTINSNGKFADTNPGIKKSHNHIKTVASK